MCGVGKHIGTREFSLAFKVLHSHSRSTASLEPGGWLEDLLMSTSPLLDLTIRPRMNIYIASDESSSLIIDATISYIHGQPFYDTKTNITSPFIALFIDANLEGNGQDFVSGQYIMISSNGNEFLISLKSLTPDSSLTTSP